MLSQVQIIRSLGEALGWLERELEWGAPLAELRHLTGRIGELYAAMLTRGQMATAVNQRGYDVVGKDGDRISIKTVTSSGRASFNPQTLDLVDRIMVFRINIDDDQGVTIETLLDTIKADFPKHLRHLANGEVDFPTRQKQIVSRPLGMQTIVAKADWGEWTVRQYESGTIEVLKSGSPVPITKPALREIAAKLGVDLHNSSDRLRNTRQLGVAVIDTIESLG